MKKILFISFAFLLTFAFTVESFLNITKAEGFCCKVKNIANH